MTKIHQTTFRLTAETKAGIERLARLWGPTVPLSGAEVLAELVRRALETEAKAAKRKEKAK